MRACVCVRMHFQSIMSSRQGHRHRRVSGLGFGHYVCGTCDHEVALQLSILLIKFRVRLKTGEGGGGLKTPKLHRCPHPCRSNSKMRHSKDEGNKCFLHT